MSQKELINAAIRLNNLERVRELIGAGEDPNIPDRYDVTPLATATSFGKIDMIILLVKLGADINKENKKGISPLNVAILHNNLDMVRFLVKLGADINKENKKGIPPLKFAILFEYNNMMIRLLVELGADVDNKNKDGETALFILVNELETSLYNLNVYEDEDEDEEGFLRGKDKNIYIKEHIEHFENALKILLENNANPYLKNNEGETIFDIAQGNIQITNSINKIIRDVNQAKKKIAIDAYMRSRDVPYSPPNAENPLAGFYYKGGDDITEQVLNMVYGKDEEENKGAEESKGNRGDGGRRRKSIGRKKSIRKKSLRKKSKSKRRKSKSKRKKIRSKRRKSGRK